MKRTKQVSLAKSEAEAEAEARGFAEVVRLIEASRYQALRAVNTALIDLYWRVGEMLSQRIADGEWGMLSSRASRRILPELILKCAASPNATCSE